MEKNIVPGQMKQPTEVQAQPAKPWPRIVLFLVLGLFFVGGLVFAAIKVGVLTKQQEKACTTEAKICPDGSTVGRTGPNCEFAPCPTQAVQNETANWKTYTHNALNFSLQYPPTWQIAATSEPVVVALMPKMLKATNGQFIKLLWYENKNLLDPEAFYEELEKNNYSGDPISPFRQEEPIIKKLQSGEVVYYFDKIYCVATCRMAVWAYKDAIYEFVDHTKGFATNHQQLVRDSDFDLILSTFRFLDQSQTDETANWKTYRNNDLSFRYPQEWSVSSVSDYVITSDLQKISLIITPSDSTLMNECMQEISTETKNNLTIKKFSRVITGEMCATSDPTPREIWVMKSPTVYAPGISYNYSSLEGSRAEAIFNQILSTFRFLPQED